MQSNTGYVFSPTIENSRALMGMIISLPITTTSTGGRCCCIEVRALPGQEPPPHRHVWENEFFYIMEGTMRAYCGSEIFDAKPGDYVFLPAGIPHTFRITSSTLHALAVVTSVDDRAVGSQNYFAAMSSPASSMVPSNEGIIYPTTDPAVQLAMAAENGTVVLSKEEAIAQMPAYPGFGASA